MKNTDIQTHTYTHITTDGNENMISHEGKGYSNTRKFIKKTQNVIAVFTS